MTVITFSIFATLSLNYVKFLNSDVIQADIKDMVDKRRSELIAAYNAADDKAEGQDVNQWVMQNMDRLLTLAETSGQSWNNSMRTVMETAQGINTAEQQKQQSLDDIVANFYVETIPRTFFAFILKLDDLSTKYFFDFFMIAIPAVFYDLLAPLAITVVLFLMGFRSRKEIEADAITEATASAPPPPKPVEETPDIKDLTTYIENAMQEEYQILPDEAVPNIDVQKCAKLRKHLSSYIYKGSPLISEAADGQYISIFDKVNLIRFITLQNNVRREGE
jgi:hypothetical protein